MARTMDTVGASYEALGSKDWDRLRKLLGDNFAFRGSELFYDSKLLPAAGRA